MNRACSGLPLDVAQPTITRADVGLRSERGPILGSVMLSVGLVAIDTTILATAVPSIVNDLGGFAHFPWLFSIFLLAQAVTVPIFAKFSDMVGRKPVLLIGVGHLRPRLGALRRGLVDAGLDRLPGACRGWAPAPSNPPP